MPAVRPACLANTAEAARRVILTPLLSNMAPPFRNDALNPQQERAAIAARTAAAGRKPCYDLLSSS